MRGVLARCGPTLRRLFKAPSNRGSEPVNRHEDRVIMRDPVAMGHQELNRLLALIEEGIATNGEFNRGPRR